MRSNAYCGNLLWQSSLTLQAQMAKWSSRNVFPAKVGLGIMFAVLAALVLLG